MARLSRERTAKGKRGESLYRINPGERKRGSLPKSFRSFGMEKGVFCFHIKKERASAGSGEKKGGEGGTAIVRRGGGKEKKF